MRRKKVVIAVAAAIAADLAPDAARLSYRKAKKLMKQRR